MHTLCGNLVHMHINLVPRGKTVNSDACFQLASTQTLGSMVIEAN